MSSDHPFSLLSLQIKVSKELSIFIISNFSFPPPIDPVLALVILNQDCYTQWSILSPHLAWSTSSLWHMIHSSSLIVFPHQACHTSLVGHSFSSRLCLSHLPDLSTLVGLGLNSLSLFYSDLQSHINQDLIVRTQDLFIQLHTWVISSMVFLHWTLDLVYVELLIPILPTSTPYLLLL